MPSAEEKGHGGDSPKKQGPRMLAVIKAACRAPVIQTACCFVFPLWLPVYIFMPASVEEDCVLISSERERKGKKKKKFLLLDLLGRSLPDRTGPRAAAVNTSRMFASGLTKKKRKGLMMINVLIPASSFFSLLPFQPTIADILNLGWWATAAAW